MDLSRRHSVTCVLQATSVCSVLRVLFVLGTAIGVSSFVAKNKSQVFLATPEITFCSPPETDPEAVSGTRGARGSPFGEAQIRVRFVAGVETSAAVLSVGGLFGVRARNRLPAPSLTPPRAIADGAAKSALLQKQQQARFIPIPETAEAWQKMGSRFLPTSPFSHHPLPSQLRAHLPSRIFGVRAGTRGPMFSHAANGFGEFPGAWLPERFLVDTRAGNAGPSAGPVGNAPSRADAPFAVPSQVPKKPTQPLFPDDRSASGSSDNDSAERHGGHHKSGPGGKHGGRRDNRRVEPPASDDRGSCLDTLQLAPPGAHGPSGPRKAGEGVDPDETQRVVDAEWLACDDEGCQGARVRVTLLAAGFVIGASGASVRELSMKTNTTIQSWTEAPGGRDVRTRWHENHGHFSGKVANPTRVFRIKGTAESVSDAASIIREAVARYNELCEDKKKGEFVRRTQKVRDVEFSYQPPPKTASAGFNGGGPGFGVGKRHGSFNGSVRSQSGNKESYNLGAVGSASAPGFFPGNLSGFGDGNTMNSNQLRLLQQQLAQMPAASGFSHGFGGMSGMSGGMGGDFYHGNAQGNHAQGNHPQGNHAQGYHPQAAMFSLPVGTDPAVVAAAAQAAAHAVAAAAANRTGAGGQYAQPDTNMGGGMGAAGHRGDGFGVAPRTHRDRRGSSQHLPSNPSFDNLWASSAQWDPSAIGVHGQVTNAIPS